MTIVFDLIAIPVCFVESAPFQCISSTEAASVRLLHEQAWNAFEIFPFCFLESQLKTTDNSIENFVACDESSFESLRISKERNFCQLSSDVKLKDDSLRSTFEFWESISHIKSGQLFAAYSTRYQLRSAISSRVNFVWQPCVVQKAHRMLHDDDTLKQ